MKTTWMLIKIWYHISFFVFGESQDSEMLLVKFLYFSLLTIIVMIIDKDHEKMWPVHEYVPLRSTVMSEYQFFKEFSDSHLSYNACIYFQQDLLLVKVSQGKGTRLVTPSNATINNKTNNWIFFVSFVKNIQTLNL